MKNILTILSLLVLVGCQTGDHVPPSKFKTIMIKSVGELETLPNMATFQIGLECLDRSIKTSKQCLVDKSNELRDKLLSFGLDKDDILTTSVDMNKSYTWQNRSRVFTGYRSSTTVYVTVRNMDKLGEIYTELLENQNLNLGGLSYAHSEMDSLKNEAYINALKKSEILSEKLLGQLPETQKEILKIGNIEITASLPEANESKFDAEYDVAEVAVRYNSIAINKGTVKVTATLFVEYQIK